MRVFKFGGASIATAGRMVDLLPVIKTSAEPLVLVVSALGKTTNALEKVVIAAVSKDIATAKAEASKLFEQHCTYAKALLDASSYAQLTARLNDYFTELNNSIDNVLASSNDEAYDSIVCMGEIFSTLIFSFYLHQAGIENTWVDARNVIKTDSNFRDANVDWETSKQQAEKLIKTELTSGKAVITQGFIGSDQNGKSVTLGREGSDYSAALIAAMLGLESVTIWKDVEGLLNADPKIFQNTERIESISFNEVIEMAFYGAQIIHPKTIKPLQNHNIPLYVKCFLNPDLKGTAIVGEVPDGNYPPLIALKQNQVLVQLTTRDFSFITENSLSTLYNIFYTLKIKINMIQNAAISFVACIDNREEKIEELVKQLSPNYKVLLNENVSVLTIRHYRPDTLSELTANRQILLKQETRKTVQVVLK